MPNYSLIANSTFQPFTYQELAMPLDRMEAYHEKLAEEYDKLSSQADVLEAMGSNDRDKHSGTYNKYKAYSDALRTEADNLYRFGLNTESRQRLSDLRRRYNTDIVPIQNAWNKREQEANDQMKARLSNPSLMFTRDAQNTSLDEYVANPTGGYGVINGANIAAQMGAMAKNLAKQVRSGQRERIDDFTFKYIEKYGLTEDLIRNWQDSPTLTAMFNQVMKANGVTPEALQGSLNADNIIAQSTNYAQMGMWNAMGEDKSQVMDDWKARADDTFNRQVELENIKQRNAAALASAKKGDDLGMPEISEEAAGIKTADGYVYNGREIMGDLKTGTDGLKSSYFGKTENQVNPLQVYEDYQEELKKNQRIVGAGRYARPVGTNKARENTLRKFAKYGVTDIISKDQYDLLKSMGYDNNSQFGTRYSDIEGNLNKLATKYTRYSTNMAGYDVPDEKIRTNLLRLNDQQFSGNVWEMKEDGSLGKPIGSAKKLNLQTTDNTKGNTIKDIQYDPQHKTKLVITLSDGSRQIVSPNIIDSRLTNAIESWENAKVGNQVGYDPRIITAMIARWLNTYNKQKGKTGDE